jgi:hypothetical protein
MFSFQDSPTCSSPIQGRAALSIAESVGNEDDIGLLKDFPEDEEAANVREQIGWRWMLPLSAGSMDLRALLRLWTKVQYMFGVLS